MSVFNYTLPSGATFRLSAPTGTTQLQADLIFYQQVAAGALVGYSPGQTLTSKQTAVTKFALTRQDRGTAGVDTQAILSIVNNIPTSVAVPSLINTPLTQPIGHSDLVRVNAGELAPAAIGPLRSSQVQGILAQITNLVDQPADQMSNNKGVGQYGLSCVQLEQAGYVKPGTWQRFIFDPAPLTDVLSAPGIWTGLKGVNSAVDFLSNPSLQTGAQNTLLQNGYNGLVSAGIINPATTSAITATLGRVFTSSGLQTLTDLGARASDSIAGVSSLVNNSINSVTSIASGAVGAINSVTSIASGAVNSLNSLSSIASNLTNTAIGDVGALVTNAGRFGTAATAAWSELSTGSISTITGELTSLASTTVSNITDQVSSISSGVLSELSGSFNGLVDGLGGNLSELTSSLDITGKAGQFATAFGDPLASLNDLGSLTSSLTGSLGSLGSLTGSLGSLTGSLGSLTGSLGSLTGSLGSLTGSLGSLGSLTGSLGSLGGLFGSLGGLGSLGAIGGLFGGGDGLTSATQIAAGYSNTVNRATLDVALTKIIGSSKVPPLIYDFPSANSISLNASSDITAAANILQNLKSQGVSLLNQGQNAINTVTNLAGSASRAGGIISNALSGLG